MYGVWNGMKKEFQFGIYVHSKKRAWDVLYKKIGNDARKWRFEIKEIPQRKLEEMMMADRALMHKSKLEDLKTWLVAEDWKIVDTKGEYEVLRANKGKEWVILYSGKSKEHYSVSNGHAKVIRDFLNSKPQPKSVVDLPEEEPAPDRYDFMTVVDDVLCTTEDPAEAQRLGDMMKNDVENMTKARVGLLALKWVK